MKDRGFLLCGEKKLKLQILLILKLLFYGKHVT